MLKSRPNKDVQARLQGLGFKPLKANGVVVLGATDLIITENSSPFENSAVIS
jgi:hypothetical protein